MDHAETAPVRITPEDCDVEETRPAGGDFEDADADYSKFVVDQLRRLCIGEVTVKTVPPQWMPPCASVYKLRLHYIYVKSRYLYLGLFWVDSFLN